MAQQSRDRRKRRDRGEERREGGRERRGGGGGEREREREREERRGAGSRTEEANRSLEQVFGGPKHKCSRGAWARTENLSSSQCQTCTRVSGIGEPWCMRGDQGHLMLMVTHCITTRGD